MLRCLVITLAILVLLVFEGTVAQACSIAAKTLTTSCGKDFCGAYEPCLANNYTECQSSSSSSAEFPTNCTSVGDDGCEYSCFQAFGANNSDPTEFIFLIPYDSDDNTSYTSYATADNNVVTSMGQLVLSPQTNYVWIQGGSGYQQIDKGRVAHLELDDNLLTSQSQVTSLSLVAMNLSDRIYDIPSLVPSSITELSLSNTLLSEFPSHLASLQNVTMLHLSSNYITTVNSSITWEKLTLLDLYQNNVSTFESNFPGLTDLYLNGNNLTEIPAVVFTLQNLIKLTIHNNPLTNRTFTEEQISFLEALASLDLTNDDFVSDPNCSLSDQRVLGDNNVVVCAINLNEVENSVFSSASSGLEATHISGSTSVESDTSSSSGVNQGGSMLVVAIVVISIVVVALAATAGYYWKQHKLEKAKGVYNNMQRASSKQRAMTVWNDLELLALQVNCDDIQDIRLIGSGSFGVVWLVRYRNSELLASKRILNDTVITERTQAFVEEIKLVSKLDHPNIVALIGAAWSSGSDLQALFEFVENGDLRSYLAAPSLPRYWTRVKVQLAVDVIEALVYVHSFTPPLAYRTLKSRNVLISADMRAKLTDVGVSGFRSRNGTMTAGIGTRRWLAPEIISGSSDYDQSADIFAFGVLLSEFDTHALPYDDAVGNNGNALEDVTILQMIASGNLRPTFSDTCPPVIFELAKQCMSQEPRDRPPALKIAYALRTLQREASNL
ncbi:hypothetical protein KRP22_003122 [Phytophthora ramorum]|uniref:putative serine/threonine-protein kinase drkB n=1 Tax=Phytophthora ramorum TaxID=164328 RepID=UPI0030A535C2|nr:putative serine/threonine-protein kinase drkB [Phytophthora ramorum]KAH7503725.1 putative serine/threonine-protein kinase drkB [Phytophthora ramorum]